MCLTPVLIDNPNRLSPSKLKALKPGDIRLLYDCTSQKIQVPCGHCPQCIAVRQMGYVQRVQMESLENHLFFATLTYNEESLPKIETSSGFKISYADPKDLQNCFKRLRTSNAFPRPFRYFAVTERGSEHGRPHAHVLFSIPKEDGDSFFDCLNLESLMFDALLHEWRRNYGSRRVPEYRPLCTYVRKFVCGRLKTNYDLHYVVPSGSDSGFASVAFYVLKYMLKPSDKETRLQQALHLNLPPEEYEKVWKTVKSKCFYSLGYGLNPSALTHVRDSVALSIKSKMDYPCFVNPETGSTFPLSRYYKNHRRLYDRESGTYSDWPLFTLDDRWMFYYLQDKPGQNIDSIAVLDSDVYDLSKYEKKMSDYRNSLDKTKLDILDLD